MKRLVLFLLFCVYLLNTNAQQVTLREAQTAATFALLGEYEANERSAVQNSLSVSRVNRYSVQDTTFMYEVLFNNGKGVLLSGNKNCLPVLGRLGNTTMSVFDSNAPCCLTAFLEGYVDEIRESFIDTRSNSENTEKWDNLLAGNINRAPARVEVEPLTKSKWGQNVSNDYLLEYVDPKHNDYRAALVYGDCEAYNSYDDIPKNSNVCGSSPPSFPSTYCDVYTTSKRCAAGCVAVAMGQIMYYHKYPMQFDWCNMTDELISEIRTGCTSQWIQNPHGPGTVKVTVCSYVKPRPTYEKERNAIAHLLSECGLAAKMDYCLVGHGCGSGASITDAKTALENYGYNAVYKKGNNIKIADLKANLNIGRPVLYSNINHAFVCDGYSSDNFFHFNWGQNGDSFWFTLDNVSGSPLKNCEAVLDIYPTNNIDYCNYNVTISNIFMLFFAPKYPTNLIFDFPDNAPYTINSGQNVTYTAHNSIVIKPGFHAKSGSNFRAYIEPCAKCPQGSPSSAPQNPNVYLENENEHSNNITNLSSSISVFPNPTTGIVNIIAENTKIESISVFDISGKVLENNTSFTGNTLDLSRLSNGIYFIKIKTLSEQVTHKVIIQK